MPAHHEMPQEHNQQGLVVNKICKAFRGRVIVNSVSLHVNPREIVGLLGRNGAGKTSSFYTIVGLVSPDSGTVLLDGVDITKLPLYHRARLGIGYLPQEASVFRGLTVEENILAVLQLCMRGRMARQNQLEKLLSEFSIETIRYSKAGTLSGGERRRVEIARCLASNPKYILFDEPFAGIDPIAARDIRNLVFHLRDRNVGILITDHNWRETLDLVERVYVLSEGVILAEGTPAEVLGNENFIRGYLGSDDEVE
ncbi:MAG: LPS export ABC transporter ATP-binding protein [Rhodobacteraceae bacterium]|nr:LPS export ABC transporter ATP-binding protein [Paracoccaceae bacterium]MCY4196221.1 LPS export ABC transporter ATP-binding protein [Paracoccaceae bacterium]MCY4326809.1 LPS export ABC transporter ATP-binding protein [Paracoccaceae bacterium]